MEDIIIRLVNIAIKIAIILVGTPIVAVIVLLCLLFIKDCFGFASVLLKELAGVNK